MRVCNLQEKKSDRRLQ